MSSLKAPFTLFLNDQSPEKCFPEAIPNKSLKIIQNVSLNGFNHNILKFPKLI
jgi:hypothetical protein